MVAWSPSQYLKFEDERSRPARDLLAQVPLTSAREIVDIGCGPGNSTEFLAQRFPEASLIGIDASTDMLEDARIRLPQARFIEADVTRWRPDGRPDLLFANAVFQWVPHHLDVLARLFEALPPGGVLAIQVPDNLDEPSHEAMREVAEAGPWARKFILPIEREPIPAPSIYYDRLRSQAGRIDIWHTFYQHVLKSPGEIVEWVKGTGLRPYLARLDASAQIEFIEEYTLRLAEAYKPLVDGCVLLRFPRLFLVAVRA